MALKAQYSLLNKPSFESLYNVLSNLSPRDKLIATGAAVLLVVLLIILPLSVVSGKISNLKKGILQSQTKFQQVLDKVAEYEYLQAEITGLEKKMGRGVKSMTSTIESLTKKQQLANNVEGLKERPTIQGDRFVEMPVELKLRNITIKKLVEFLYSVETYPTALMQISKLQVKPLASNRAFMEVTMEISGISLRGEG